MPILIKEIIPEGDFLVSANGQRVPESFKKERLERLAATANKMIQSGLKIPVPFDHSKDAIPIVKDGAPASSFNNAGYWDQWFIGTNDEGKPVLKAATDLAGSDNEPDSPYYKARNTAKEVSVNIRNKFVDGLGREWNDCIMHAALVNHAVVPGQKGFEVLEDSTVVNMSMSIETGDDSEFVIIGQIRAALQEAVNLTLPESTDKKTFMRDLLCAALQLKSTRNTSNLEPVPIYMSIGDDNVPLSKEQAESIVATKAVNPTTNKPYTMEDLGFKPAPPPSNPTNVDMSAILKEKDEKIEKVTRIAQAFAKKLVTDTKDAIQRRIDNLVAKNVITKEYADAHLVPKIGFEMSIDPATNDIAPHQLDLVLSAIENSPQALAASAPQTYLDPLGGGSIQIPPADHRANDLSADDMNKAIEEFVSVLPSQELSIIGTEH